MSICSFASRMTINPNRLNRKRAHREDRVRVVSAEVGEEVVMTPGVSGSQLRTGDSRGAAGAVEKIHRGMRMMSECCTLDR